MTEQDKQALIKHFCERDCGEEAENCEIMPCHEIELIQEFPTTEPDTDTISRQAAIDICRAPHMRNADCSDFEMAIMMLPPAQPEPKRGKWVLVCDNNGMHFICNKCGAWRYHQEQNFCGECGADMREVTECLD